MNVTIEPVTTPCFRVHEKVNEKVDFYWEQLYKTEQEALEAIKVERERAGDYK